MEQRLPLMSGQAEIAMKKECCLRALSAILVAGFLAVGTAQGAIDSREREAKKRVELTVVEKKQDSQPRGNEPRRQRPERRH